MSTESSQPAGEDSEENRLVFAVCHEIGNWVTAIRLQAHLLDEDLGPKDLALASIEVDELCARTSAVLSQLRPLLAAGAPKQLSSTPAAVLSALEHGLTDLGGRGASLVIERADDLGELTLDPEALHAILVTTVLGAIDAVRPEGKVVVRAEPGDAELQIVVLDDSGSDEDLPGWRDQALRGRILACALADRILSRSGGRLEVSRCEGQNRVAFCLPTAA